MPKWIDLATCWTTEHIWFEYWHGVPIDRCTRCGKMRDHKVDGCSCTVCARKKNCSLPTGHRLSDNPECKEHP